MITVITNDYHCFFGTGNRFIPLYRRLDTNDYHDYHEFSSLGGCSTTSFPHLDEAQFFIGSESSMAGYYRWADQTDSADHPHGKVA